ncbi:MAG: DUF2062 domain-containing protein [Lentisphaeria bacterium]|nr:DUF2062 domain-containing protein [Lentisphaeria bacterium]MBR7128188.1 DUF2062 domain-containing protein [Lentisphaeria bacterium]
MSVKSYIKRKAYKLYNKIVHEKASPSYIARGWAIGMFYGCTIPFGFQLMLSIPTSFLLKGSKIGASLGTLLTNPVTIFIIYPIQCYVGNHILGGSLSYAGAKQAVNEMLKEQTIDSMMQMGWDLVAAFFLGGFLWAAIMTPLTYFVVKKLVVNYRKVKEARRAKRALKKQQKKSQTV